MSGRRRRRLRLSRTAHRRIARDCHFCCGCSYPNCENEKRYVPAHHGHPRGMASAIRGALGGDPRNAKPDPLLEGSGIGITDSQRHHPRGRLTAKSSGRSPGLGFSLGPAFPLAQWRDGPPSPDTVAGQRRNLTDFPNTGCGLDNYLGSGRQSIAEIKRLRCGFRLSDLTFSPSQRDRSISPEIARVRLCTRTITLCDGLSASGKIG